MPPSRIACLLPCAVSDDAARNLALDALADAATGFSPDIERASDAVYLEVGDLRRLYPTETALIAALRGSTVDVGVPAAIAIAGDKGIARVRARGLLLLHKEAATAIVFPGAERSSLAPLPIAALGPPRELLSRISLWGLHTLGELSSLPRPQVVTRLGAAGAVLHRLACGESAELLQKTAPTSEVREEQALLDALENLEPLLFVLRGLLDRLTARLRARSQACGHLTLRLQLSPRGEEVRPIAVAAPTQNVAPLLMLLRVALEAQPPAQNVERLILIATPANPRPTQLDLFAPPGPAPEQLATTLARLEALCGSGRVGRPVVPDSHAPGAAALVPFTTPPPPKGPLPQDAPAEPDANKTLQMNDNAQVAAQVQLSARVVRPPKPIVVGRRDGALCEVRLESKGGPVRRSGGPYRLRDVKGVRDYYDVELQDGDLLRLFYDLSADRWYLDAFYD